MPKNEAVGKGKGKTPRKRKPSTSSSSVLDDSDADETFVPVTAGKTSDFEMITDSEDEVLPIAKKGATIPKPAKKPSKDHSPGDDKQKDTRGARWSDAERTAMMAEAFVHRTILSERHCKRNDIERTAALTSVEREYNRIKYTSSSQLQ